METQQKLNQLESEISLEGFLTGRDEPTPPT